MNIYTNSKRYMIIITFAAQALRSEHSPVCWNWRTEVPSQLLIRGEGLRLVMVHPCGTDVTFDLSFQPDCTEVWPSERRGAQDLDRGRHRLRHRPRLPERPEKWSHSLRVRRGRIRCQLHWSKRVLIIFFLMHAMIWKLNPPPFFFSFPLRLVNKLQPGSVKKINKSALNWHQVSWFRISPFIQQWV